jgi:hypothetical protein
LLHNFLLYSGGKWQTNPVGKKKLLRKTIKAGTVVIKNAALKKLAKATCYFPLSIVMLLML